MGKPRLPKGFYWRGGTIHVRTDPLTGKRSSTHCHDPKAAQLWRAERERLAASPGYAASTTATVGEWVAKTIQHKRARGKREGTMHMYGVKLGHVIRVFGEGSPLSAITPGAVDDYITLRSSEGAKNNTISRELTCLRQLLRIAKRAGAYGLDIAEVMPVGFSADYKPVERVLALPDLPRLWNALRNDSERAWFAYALATGADVGDIERAQPEDYDPARGVVRIRGTKTAVRDAEVPVLPHVRELFEYAHARMPLSWPRASKGLGEACARAGLPHLSPKDLRRTAASLLVAGGADISLVSRFLRHGSDTMVRKVYGKVRPEELGRLLAAQTGTETSQITPRPLGGMADAGDLKGGAHDRETPKPGKSASSNGGVRLLQAPNGAQSSTDTSQAYLARCGLSLQALTLAAERVFARRVAS
jgi:integrase/recombinase XerC